jgi:AcrR family transcriptional regulator
MIPKRNPTKTRELIVEAAFHEFHRHGFQAASLKRILAHTGVTKGALYHHFPNKRALGYAVVEEVLENMVEDDWLRPLETAENPINCLKEELTAFNRTAGENDLLLGCPLNNLALEMSPADEGFRVRLNRIYDRWREKLAEALERGQTAGQVRKDIDALQTATFIVGAMAGCRSLAKNAQSAGLMKAVCKSLIDYWESLRA